VSAIAVHGNTPITQPTVTGENLVDALNSLLSALENYGWIEDGTAIVAGDPDLSSAQGDRNLAIITLNNLCEAANYVAQRVADDVDVLFDVVPQNAFNIYEFLIAQHGMDVIGAKATAQAVMTHVADEIAIRNNIQDIVADMVIWLANNNFNDQQAFSEAIDTMTGNPGVIAIASALITTYTIPTWQEMLFTGEFAGAAPFGCDPCEGLEPGAGNDWAITWSGIAMSDDWSVFDCGAVFTMEINCAGSGENASLDLRFIPPGPPDTTFTITRVEVSVGYDLNNVRDVDGICRFNTGTIAFPIEALDGIGSHTFIGIGSTTGEDGLNLDVEMFSNDAFSIGDTVTVTSIRMEGTGLPFESSGVTC
jgi:hypothetical protein